MMKLGQGELIRTELRNRFRSLTLSLSHLQLRV